MTTFTSHAIVRMSWEKLVHTCNVPPVALVRLLLPLPKYFAPPGSKHTEREREFHSSLAKENFRDPLRLNNSAEGHVGRSIHIPFVWHEENAFRHIGG